MPLIPGWPNGVAYQDAIQAPHVCFTSQRLKAVQIRTNNMGLPQAATGRSAIVFRAGVGYEDVALRCFTREAAGQQSRYRALHEHLNSSIPRYMVDFEYWDREILVEGKRYPVIEMGWAEGQPLHLWVEQHLRRPYHFVRLADIWRDIVKDLEIREMAHGDLSSDNCLVIGDNLTLIDYDDFFIGRLAKSDPGEGGNPHFQHLGRMGYYALNMDAFPALVIYLSLVALAADTSLWRFHNGKNLIFTDKDYMAPRATPLWEALAKSPDKRIKPLVTALADMCAEPIKDLPLLSQLTPGRLPPWWLTPVAWQSLILTARRGSLPRQASVPDGGPRRLAALLVACAGLVLVAILLTIGLSTATTPTTPSAAGISSAAFSPDGTTLAEAHADGTIHLWDVPAKSLIDTLNNSPGRAVSSVAFSPDGTTLATADANASTYLWNLPANNLIAALPDPGQRAVVWVAFSPDGKTLATADAGGSTYLWNLPTNNLITTLTDPGQRAVVSVAFSPDGKTLATADAGGSTYLWNLPGKNLITTLTDLSQRAVIRVAFNPDGKTLTTVDADGVTYTWNVPAQPPS
jgi:eukaryotic-like serine/threonine-protein kinase